MAGIKEGFGEIVGSSLVYLMGNLFVGSVGIARSETSLGHGPYTVRGPPVSLGFRQIANVRDLRDSDDFSKKLDRTGVAGAAASASVRLLLRSCNLLDDLILATKETYRVK